MTERNRLEWLNLPAFIAVAISGGSYVVTKFVLMEISPLTVVGARMLGSAPLLLMLAWAVDRRMVPDRRHWPAVLAMMLSFGLTQMFWTLGIPLTQVSVAALLFATAPIFVVVIAALIGQERFKSVRAVGIVISFVGVALVVGADPSVIGSGRWEGIALMQGAGIGWALTIVFTAGLLKYYNALTLTAWAVSGAAIISLPLTVGPLLEAPWATLGLGTWLGLAYVTFMTNLVSRVLWFAGLSRGSTITSVYTFLEPLFAAIFAAIFLSEWLNSLQLIGALIILAGISITKELVPWQRIGWQGTTGRTPGV